MILDEVKIHKYTHINHKLSVCLVGERGRMEPLHSHHAPIWLEETQSGAALESKYSLHIRNHTARKNWLNLTAHECSCSSFLSSNRYEQPLSPSPCHHHHRWRCRLHPSRHRPPSQPPALVVLLAPSFSLTIDSRHPHSPSCSCPSDSARLAEALNVPPRSSSPSPSTPSPVLSARPSCAQAAGHHQDPPECSLLPCSASSFLAI
jgi:hypothetical protein